MQLDISDPENPKVASRIWLGGVIRKGSPVEVQQCGAVCHCVSAGLGSGSVPQPGCIAAALPLQLCTGSAEPKQVPWAALSWDTLLALLAVTRSGREVWWRCPPRSAASHMLHAVRPLCCGALQVISGLPDGMEAPEVPTVQGKMLQGGPQMLQVCAVAELPPARHLQASLPSRVR